MVVALLFFHDGVAKETAIFGVADVERVVVGEVVVAAEEDHFAEERVAGFAKRLVNEVFAQEFIDSAAVYFELMVSLLG